MCTSNTSIQSTVRQVHTSNDVDNDNFVIVNYNDHFHLAKVKVVDHVAQEVQLQYYEPAFPSITFYVSRSKNRHNHNNSIMIQDILLALLHNPVVGQQNEVYLNHEQFGAIQNICDEF